MGKSDTKAARERRHTRVREKVKGTPERPRLCVFRSLSNIYAQIIDDTKGHTLICASTIDLEMKPQLDGKNKSSEADMVGAAIAKRALEKGIKQVVFDRGGFKYHGRIKALAEAARREGLIF